MPEIKRFPLRNGIKTYTRQWTSGRIRFVLMMISGHPERSYITFEKDFFGRSKEKPQRFILRFHDWQELKKLIDNDLAKEIGWDKIPSVTESIIQKSLKENPDFLEAILKAENIPKLSGISLESLDRLAIRIFEIKKENIELILTRLAESKDEELITFASLLEDLKLNQISMLSALVFQKLKIIDLLEKITCNKEISEKSVHELFENNIWLSGRNLEIVQSDKPLNTYLDSKISKETGGRKRPDIIVKKIPYKEEIILIELKAPGVKLEAKDIGQILEYKAIIKQNKPSTKEIHCFLYGYEKSQKFVSSKDVIIKTFSEIIAELREEYTEYFKILESGREIDSLEFHN